MVETHLNEIILFLGGDGPRVPGYHRVQQQRSVLAKLCQKTPEVTF